jgi:transketolase
MVIFACGVCVAEALGAAEKLAADGINAAVVNIHTIKPIDKDKVLEFAKKTNRVFTVEEHSVIGGLGSAVCDVLAEEYPVKVTKIGVYDRFGKSGPAGALMKELQLDAEGIYNQIKAKI